MVRPDLAAAEQARCRHPGNGVSHPLSGCFVCGPERADGLHVSAGPVSGRGVVGATPFTPDESVTEDGIVPAEIVWAVLDCPSYVPDMWPGLRSGETMSLLGRLTAERLREVRAGEALVAVGWPLGSQGRKRLTASALLDEQGETVARAQATWIQVR